MDLAGPLPSPSSAPPGRARPRSRSSSPAIGAEIVCADSRQIYRGPRSGDRQADARPNALAFRTTGFDLLAPANPRAPAATRRARAPADRRGRRPRARGAHGRRHRALPAGALAGLAGSGDSRGGPRASARPARGRRGPEALHAELAARRPRAGRRLAPATGSGSRAASRWPRHRAAALGVAARAPRAARPPGAGIWSARRAARAERIQRSIGATRAFFDAGCVEEARGLLDRRAARGAGLRRAGLPRGLRHLLDGRLTARRRSSADPPHRQLREAPGDLVARRGTACDGLVRTGRTNRPARWPRLAAARRRERVLGIGARREPLTQGGEIAALRLGVTCESFDGAGITQW